MTQPPSIYLPASQALEAENGFLPTQVGQLQAKFSQGQLLDPYFTQASYPTSYPTSNQSQAQSQYSKAGATKQLLTNQSQEIVYHKTPEFSRELNMQDLQAIRNTSPQQTVDNTYEIVLKMIIETEKTAVDLNKSYQNLLQQSTVWRSPPEACPPLPVFSQLRVPLASPTLSSPGEANFRFFVVVSREVIFAHSLTCREIYYDGLAYSDSHIC